MFIFSINGLGASIALDDAIEKLEKEINHTRVCDLFFSFAQKITDFLHLSLLGKK